MNQNIPEFDEEVLRGLSLEGIDEPEGKVEQLPISKSLGLESDGTVQFTVEPKNEPQEKRVKYYVTDQNTGRRFYVGYVAHYGSRKGLATSRGDELIYDRFQAEDEIGAWAHFMYPTVMAESRGRHLTFNSYDRAHFTWGFYQLAAHTANDNLILLMRELLSLSSASTYFPDLTLEDGKVHQVTDGGLKNLEKETVVQLSSWKETQIVDFMEYLNPKSKWVDNEEVVTAAKFIDWVRNDPEMLSATIRISAQIMKKKAKYFAQRYNLIGERPELMIWVSDIHHQGRAKVTTVRKALEKPTFEEKLEALSKIGSSDYNSRKETVKKHVQQLLDEGRFIDTFFGEGELSFDD